LSAWSPQFVTQSGWLAGIRVKEPCGEMGSCFGTQRMSAALETC
jgi:hypothetical protein